MYELAIAGLLALARTCFFCSIASLSLGKKGTGQIACGTAAELLVKCFETFRNAPNFPRFSYSLLSGACVCAMAKNKHHGQWEQGTLEYGFIKFHEKAMQLSFDRIATLAYCTPVPCFQDKGEI